MYKEFETKTSYNYLREIIMNLNEPICILGGWAVFFHVNKKFEKAQGRHYLGSRDIDLGFNISGNLKQSALFQTISTLTETQFQTFKLQANEGDSYRNRRRD